MSMPSPAFDLLRPRLPSRRARAAAALSAVLLVAACLDLIVVLAWSGLAVHNARMEGVIEDYGQQEALANAQAARNGAAAREAAQIRERLEFLKTLPPGSTRSEALLNAMDRALPAGGALTGVTLGTDRRLIVTGTVPAYPDVEAYVRALDGTGEFAYVRVVSITASQGDSAGGAGGAGSSGGSAAPVPPAGVEFQLECWPRGEGSP